MPAVIVGVDGSEGADAALRYGVEEAARRGWAVKAVHVWHEPVIVSAVGNGLGGGSRRELEQGARRLLADAVGRLGDAGVVEVEQVLLEGQAGVRLAGAASAHDLLVVGTRGLGGLGRLVLGSVALACAQNARCPTVIVPPRSAVADLSERQDDVHIFRDRDQ
jgi:nucleotide-binding universal stress UspA family protein